MQFGHVFNPKYIPRGIFKGNGLKEIDNSIPKFQEI
jgi:hypothetical protein